MQLLMHSPLILDVAGLQLGAADCKRLRNPLVGGVAGANRMSLPQPVCILCLIASS